MRKILYLIIIIGTLTACNVHEWPDVPEQLPLEITLDYDKVHLFDTDMTPWEHTYDGTTVSEQGYGDVYDNRRDYGTKRYIIRAYPVSMKQRTAQQHVKELIIERDIKHGYEHEMSIRLAPGDYDIMVWSDMVPAGWSGDYFYNVDNFAEISLLGEHRANCEWRDAFRGTARVSIQPYVTDREPDCIAVEMKRPLARFELITTDLKEFVDKELEYLRSEATTRGEIPPTRVDIDEYNIVIYYSGFMPNTYNMYTDKPVDSATGVSFESEISPLDEKEASLGFDYVFVNGKESAVSVQVAIYNKKNELLAMSNPFNVPLKRNHNTVIKGSFLMEEASGGITINPDFDGEHNIVIR